MSCNQLNEQNLTELVETMVSDNFLANKKWPPIVTGDQTRFCLNSEQCLV